MIFLSEERAEAIRAGIGAGKEPLRAPAERLRAQAEKLRSHGPWSVTFAPSPAASGDPHDYFSEGPYWWPNPKDPKAPYIRRDGEVNPDRFVAHSRSMSALCGATRDLSLAAYFLGEPAYAQRACELLKVWFVEAKTRMNPHLEYGQAIRGVTDGRGIGIIDTVVLIGLVHGVSLLARSEGRDDAVLDGVRAWFAAYLKWLTTSKKGIEEKETPNNHATWWVAQVGAYARLVGDEAVPQEMDNRFREVLIPRQVEPNGRCPHEEARTRSLSYSIYNANAFAVICELAHHRGVDLWRFRTADGRGIAAVAEYLAPYLTQPEKWSGKQITAASAKRELLLQLAGVRLDKPAYLEAQRGLPPATSLLGPLELLDGGVTT